MKVIFLALIALTLVSCEQEIDINLNDSNPKLVIEGDITNLAGPYFVKLSKTVNFSEASNYPPVSGATVIISDNNGIVDTLTESKPGLYQTSKIIGQPGNTYYLKVRVDGNEYSANTTMPPLVNLDSLRFSVFANPGSSDNFSTIPVYTDPALIGNSYRFIQTVNGELDKTYIVFNDNVNNGVVNQRPIFSQGVDVTSGDTVTIEMRCIDKNAYTYFYTLSQISQGGPGGGTTPANPPNNITGADALGLFAAYTSQKRTQTVQ